MPDIFISYAHEDQERVRPIVKELEKLGWNVFWDRKIPPGKTWRIYLKEKLDESRCVLVVWSRDSINSKWIHAEADVADKRDILVPLFLDAVEPAFGFSHIQAADLFNWNNNSNHPAFQELIGAIESILSSSKSSGIPSENTPKPRPELLIPPLPEPPWKKWWEQYGKQAVIVLVVLVILGVVWSMNQPSPKVENTPAPTTEVLKVNQEAEARRKEDARVKAEKDLATRHAAEVAKAKQAEDVRQKAEAARLKAEKEAALQEAEQAKKLKIGDKHGGGKIAWLDATGQHGLIAAEADLSMRYSWEAAKKACWELVSNGYSDWHLPTKDELNKLYYVKSAVGGFSDYFYWSSTENIANNAWSQVFGIGSQYYSSKRNRLCVRAVRAF